MLLNPPANFIPTDSALPGIEVYRPLTPEEKAEYREVVEFKCPQCGAATAYSAGDSGLTCTHCNYYEPPPQAVAAQEAEGFEFTVAALQQAARGWGQIRKELQCQSCGAYTSLPPDLLTYTCPFCGSNKVIQRQSPQDMLRPRWLIPFKIEAATCREIARTWLGSSWMTPDSLRQLAQVDCFVGIYLPFWLFNTTARAHWQAAIGYEQKDDQGYQETVWRVKSGQAKQRFENVMMAGTSRVSLSLLGQISRYDFQQLTPYEPTYLAGFQAQSYDIPLDPAWAAARRPLREQIRQLCYDQAKLSGPKDKNCRVAGLQIALNYNDSHWRYGLLPVYLAVFTYNRKTYQVMVNGQNGTIAGQRPVDWIKIWAVVGLMLAPALLLCGFSLLLQLLSSNITENIRVLAFIGLIIGLIFSYQLIQRAQRLDDA